MHAESVKGRVHLSVSQQDSNEISMNSESEDAGDISSTVGSASLFQAWRDAKVSKVDITAGRCTEKKAANNLYYIYLIVLDQLARV